MQTKINISQKTNIQRIIYIQTYLPKLRVTGSNPAYRSQKRLLIIIQLTDN